MKQKESIKFNNMPIESRREYANTMARNKIWVPPGCVHVQYGSRRLRRALAKMNRQNKKAA